MALEDDIRTLSGVALFQSLGREQLRLLAFGVDHIALSRGHRLFREGDVAENAFIVVTGRIGLTIGNGNERTSIGAVRPGSILGELALITESQRLTDAEAMVDSNLLRVDRKHFVRILEEYPEIAQALYDSIARDLQDMVNRIEKLAPHFEG